VELKESEFFKELIDSMPIGLTIEDGETGGILNANPAFLNLLGYTIEELHQMTWKDLTPIPWLAQSEKLVAKVLSHPKKPVLEEKAYLNKNGQEIPILLYHYALEHPYFNRPVLISLVLDFSSYKNLLDQLRNISFEDTLTGTYNRRFLETQFDQHLKNDVPLTLVLCDVDNLKTANDTLGHGAGDTLLIEVANVLKSCTRSADIVARLGGDEFCILLPGTGQQGGQVVLNRIRKAIALYNEKKHDALPISLSLGTASSDVDGEKDFTSFLEIADQRMYHEKLKHKLDQTGLFD
jgi:diguanylate cyclase (GGDEF)-like protein/PAS domain S-box-containing protein